MTEREAIRKMFRTNPALMAKLMAMAKRGELASSDAIPPGADMVVVGGAWPSEIIGSKQVKCEGCSCLLSIAPSTQEMMGKRTGRTILRCLKCSVQMAVISNATPEGPTQ